MKKNVRKALAISGLTIAIGATGLALNASANTGNARFQRSHQERIVRSRRVETSARRISFRRTIPGTVSEISGNKITMASGNKTYTINTSDSTRFLDRKWQKIDLSQIQNGNKIRVFGTVSGLTVTAQTVRNISLPATTN